MRMNMLNELKMIEGTEFYMSECARMCCVYCDSDGWTSMEKFVLWE